MRIMVVTIASIVVLLAVAAAEKQSRTAFLSTGTLRRNHIVGALNSVSPSSPEQKPEQPQNIATKVITNFRKASSDGFGTRAKNVGFTMRKGDVVVPLCGNMELRQRLAGKGVYPGVEYLICEIDQGNCAKETCDSDTTQRDIGKVTKDEQRVAFIRPAYPLRDYLERSDWPISIDVTEVPLWVDKSTYEAGTALGTLALAGTFLTIASIVATFVRIAVVPSESMIPALMPGDVVLVTRSILPPKPGDVVFFDPPKELDEAIANSKIGQATVAASDQSDSTDATRKVNIVSTKGKNFIKRVVGVPGEDVGVWDSNPFAVFQCSDDSRKDCSYRIDRSGQYSRPDVFQDDSWNRVSTTINTNLNREIESNADDKNVKMTATLAKDEYFVAGDNGFRSVDSRVWGPLKRKYLFGTAQWVVFPLQHFGRIPGGPLSIEKPPAVATDGATQNENCSGPWDLWSIR